MEKGKRKRSKNFSESEKILLKEIISKHPIIEDKHHDSTTELKKRNVWTAIVNEYNSTETVNSRTTHQLQVLWKNIKIQLKKTTAIARRERFKTGGGPPVRPQTDDLGDLLTGMIESQQPLEGIPDDDHLDSSEQDDLGVNQMSEEPEQSQKNLTSAPEAAAPSISIPGSTARVLIRVYACGVNPVETYIRSGAYARKPALPYTPGTDVAGVVETVGDGVSALKVGDRVFTTSTESGGYAEYAVAAVNCVHKMPDALDFTQGAAIGIPYFTAYRALVHKAKAKAGETVLIHGASGGVGVASCQLSRALGLRVFGSAGTPEGLKMVLNNGAHQTFNHREEGYTDKIMAATGGRGVDVVIEMLSNINLSNDLQMLAHGGRVTIVGSRGPIEINPRDTMLKETSILGVALFNATPEDTKECASLLCAGMEAGWLNPVVGSKYPLDKAAEAHRDIIESPGAAGKMVLTM